MSANNSAIIWLKYPIQEVSLDESERDIFGEETWANSIYQYWLNELDNEFLLNIWQVPTGLWKDSL